MRLHRLTLEGIGPYAERQALDFDALTAQGLFLLTGPTGAGKTTVFDAIVFGLYGTVPGARGGDGKRDRRARERIVSDLRDLNTKPEVELEFTVAGRRFLVRRSPDHTRPKTRGEGLTTAKASASLEEFVDGMWVPRSTDFFEISQELQELLGMSADQFSQVVLLPQGEFAGFLRASVTDRRKVLERLFQVDRYQSVEDYLRDRAEAAKATLADAEDRRDGILDRLAGAIGTTEDEDLPGSEATTEEVRAWLANRRTATLAAESDAVRAAEVAGNTYADADAAHGRLAAVAELQTAVRSREEALERHAARMPAARQWLAEAVGQAVAGDEDRWGPAAREARARAGMLADRAVDEARVSAMQSAATDASAAADAAERSAAAADAAQAEAAAQLEPARARVSSSGRDEEAHRALTRERTTVAARLAAAEQRDQLAQTHRALGATAEQAAKARAEAEAAVEAAQAEATLDKADAERETTAHAVASRRTALERDTDQLERDRTTLAADERARAELTTERTALAAHRDAARDDHQSAREQYLSAREARLDAMAAELAHNLTDGEPCPVCGALEHPSPAAPVGGDDLRAVEAEAGAAAERAAQALASAEQALATCDGQLATLSEADLATRRGSLAARAAALATETQAVAAAEVELQSRTAELQRARAARRAAVAAADEARTAERVAEQRLSQAREEMAAASATAGDGSTEAARDALAQLDVELERLAGLIAGAAAARDRVTEFETAVERQRAASSAARTTAAQERQRAAGLREEATRVASELAALRGTHATVDAAAAAAATHAHRVEKAAELLADYRSASRELEQAREALQRRAAADPPAEGEPTGLAERIALREQARAEAHDAASRAHASLQEARRRLAALKTADEALADLAARLGPAAVAAERVIRLDATVRGTGDNVRKISLATYVLAARLEQVATAASTHLLRMSSGRYELVHHDDRYGGGQAGLGLRVRDGWTGEERDTATLSGGEAFYASLALALGLAEVVTSESGGRPLDTLLVDEGFGSLDPDTLEDVLDELDDLRAGGRAIGLVSHVETLSERIPSQLRVTPGRGGSTAEVVTAA